MLQESLCYVCNINLPKDPELFRAQCEQFLASPARVYLDFTKKSTGVPQVLPLYLFRILAEELASARNVAMLEAVVSHTQDTLDIILQLVADNPRLSLIITLPSSLLQCYILVVKNGTHANQHRSSKSDKVDEAPLAKRKKY